MQDMNDLSVAELRDLQVKAEELIASKQDQELQQAYQDIMAIAEKVNLTIEQILELGANKSKSKKIIRKTVEARYRNPNNAADTWTGRGKKPRWLAAKLEAGANIEDFMI